MVNITAKFAKEGILNNEGINHLCFEITPEKDNSKEPANTKSNVFLFLIDNSGSMDSQADNKFDYMMTSNYLGHFSNCKGKTKLDYAKDSIANFLNIMSDKDKIGVIAFSDYIEIIQEITDLDNKTKIIEAVKSIKTKGCTNISEPLKAAKNMLSKYISEFNCKIILLSDGQANIGISSKKGLGDIARDIAKENISISTLGIGVAYDAHVLGEIAEKGYGLFYHIKNLSEINKIFEEELALNNSTVAIKSTLKIKIPTLIEIGENLNGYEQSIDNGMIIIELGKINKNKKIALEIRNNFVDEDLKFEYIFDYVDTQNKNISITDTKELKVYKDLKQLEDAFEDKEIVDYILNIVNKNNLMNVAESFEVKNFDNIDWYFKNNKSVLTSLSSTYSCSKDTIENIEQFTSKIERSYSTNSVSSDDNKTLFQMSFNSRK